MRTSPTQKKNLFPWPGSRTGKPPLAKTPASSTPPWAAVKTSKAPASARLVINATYWGLKMEKQITPNAQRRVRWRIQTPRQRIQLRETRASNPSYPQLTSKKASPYLKRYRSTLKNPFSCSTIPSALKLTSLYFPLDGQWSILGGRRTYRGSLSSEAVNDGWGSPFSTLTP